MKNKNVFLAFVAAALVLIFQAADVFFIHSEDSIWGSNMLGRIIGIVIVVVFSLSVKLNIKKLYFKKYNRLTEIINGFFFAVFPIVIIFIIEYIVLRYKGYSDLYLNISFPNITADMNERLSVMAAVFYVVAVLLEALCKEMVFRGYLLSQLSGAIDVFKANVIQSVLYTLLLVPNIAQMIINGRFDGFGVKMTLFIIAGNLFVNFISGLKWGLAYRVSGSVWLSTTDHFANNLLLTCLYLTNGTMPMKWYVVQAIAVQVISFAMFIPFYLNRDRINEEIAEEVATQRELANLAVDTYSPSPMRRYIESRHAQKMEEYAKKEFEKMKAEQMPMPIMPPVIENTGETISLADMKEAADNGSLEATPDTDEDFVPEQSDYMRAMEKNRSASDLKEKKEREEREEKELKSSVPENAEPEPKNDTVPTAEAFEDEAVSDRSESADNISKLVNSYFKDNFNKHTF